MKIIIPGGSGQVGTILARAFVAQGDEVVVLSRRPTAAPWRTVAWDGRTWGDWCQEFEGADVVINMAGRSVNCRYTTSNLAEMMNSRVRSTHIVGEAIRRAQRPPKVWLNASTATIYAHTYDRPNDEETGVLGGSELDVPRSWSHSIDIAQAWERAVLEADTPHTRKVILRSAMTMSPDPGGIFSTILMLVRLGKGGRWADGRQYMSWIHDQDFVAAVRWLIEHDLSGVFNLAAPGPLPNSDFMRVLRRAWGIRFGIRSFRPLLTMGAFLLRTETELLLKSRRVVPRRLTDSGFRFNYPDWATAAENLCARARRGRSIRRLAPNESTAMA